MKEASGELSMTLIVIVAAGAILAIFLAFRQPIYDFIKEKWTNLGGQVDDQENWRPKGGYIITEGYSYVINE